jgi:biotin carboxylase
MPTESIARRVLLLSTTTGYQLRSFGEAAERLGVELLLGTDRCHHLDDPWRDGAIAVRFYDDLGSLDAILERHRDQPIDAVIAVGDRPTALAASVTQALGLPGNSVDAADATRSKKRMRERFAAAGMRTPWNFQVDASANAWDFASRVTYPCVVKPLGLSGSRGVIRADDESQLQLAIERVRALLARPDVRAQRTGLTERLLIEGYIEGHEYAVEGLLTEGRLRVLAIFDKPDPLDGPFFEETIYVTPPRAPDAVRVQIETEVQRAVTALGLVQGPVHAECRVGPASVTMLEVAARPIGGLCSGVLRFRGNSGVVSLEELLLRHALGEDTTHLLREESAAGVMMIPIPGRGIFKGVSGERAARAVPDIEDVRISAKQDQLLEPLPEGDSYLGFIFARAAGADDVISALREAHRSLAFEIDPELRMIR